MNEKHPSITLRDPVLEDVDLLRQLGSSLVDSSLKDEVKYAREAVRVVFLLSRPHCESRKLLDRGCAVFDAAASDFANRLSVDEVKTLLAGIKFPEAVESEFQRN